MAASAAASAVASVFINERPQPVQGDGEPQRSRCDRFSLNWDTVPALLVMVASTMGVAITIIYNYHYVYTIVFSTAVVASAWWLFRSCDYANLESHKALNEQLGRQLSVAEEHNQLRATQLKTAQEQLDQLTSAVTSVKDLKGLVGILEGFAPNIAATLDAALTEKLTGVARGLDTRVLELQRAVSQQQQQHALLTTLNGQLSAHATAIAAETAKLQTEREAAVAATAAQHARLQELREGFEINLEELIRANGLHEFKEMIARVVEQNDPDTALAMIRSQLVGLFGRLQDEHRRAKAARGGAADDSDHQ